MSDLWVMFSIAALVVLALGWVAFGLKRKGVSRRQAHRRAAPAERNDAPAFADEREERVARRVATAVGSAPHSVLSHVRREIEYAPGQSDEVLVKRAVYHYRQDQPERSCPVYQDGARG